MYVYEPQQNLHRGLRQCKNGLSPITSQLFIADRYMAECMLWFILCQSDQSVRCPSEESLGP